MNVKTKMLFSYKYCDLLVHANYMHQITGPAKVFLNNVIIYLNFFLDFVIVSVDKACKEVS